MLFSFSGWTDKHYFNGFFFDRGNVDSKSESENLKSYINNSN